MKRIYHESTRPLEEWINARLAEGYIVENIGAFSFDHKWQTRTSPMTPNAMDEKVTMFWVQMVLE